MMGLSETRRFQPEALDGMGNAEPVISGRLQGCCVHADLCAESHLGAAVLEVLLSCSS